MNRLRLEVDKLAVHFDRDYGCDRQTGWSAAWDSSFTCQLEPSLLRALCSLTKVIQWER
ncbi:MAG: hypothetical protein O2890_06230 [Cyanobacteria bacterium]|nr:hypothetical protein [Cyanobacteriota bacterium]